MDDVDETPLEQAIESADLVPIEEVEAELETDQDQDFESPEPQDIDEPEYTTIQYQRESQKVEDLKQLLGVSSASEVGRRTFEYVYDSRVED
jgi:hypothetical protein